MASTIFGATVYQSNDNPSNIRYDVLGANSEVFAVGDVLTIESGNLEVTDGATEAVVGVSAKKQTMSSTNQTVAKVSQPYIPAEDGTIWLMGCNAALTDNATDPGTYYKLTGATGAQQVDVVSGTQTTTSRQVVIVKVDPNSVGGTEGPQEALVKFFRTPSLNV